jgi:hypothetical protein
VNCSCSKSELPIWVKIGRVVSLALSTYPIRILNTSLGGTQGRRMGESFSKLISIMSQIDGYRSARSILRVRGSRSILCATSKANDRVQLP